MSQAKAKPATTAAAASGAAKPAKVKKPKAPKPGSSKDQKAKAVAAGKGTAAHPSQAPYSTDQSSLPPPPPNAKPLLTTADFLAAADLTAYRPSAPPPKPAKAAVAATAAAGTAPAAATPSAVDSKSAAAPTAAAAASTPSAAANPHRKPALTAEELAFFDANGYVVVKQAISRAAADAMVSDMWEFLEMTNERKDITQCYKAPLMPIGFVEMYHSPAQWANRTTERVYNAFADLWRRDDLWVSIDRCGLKLPQSDAQPQWRHAGFIHHDMDVTVAQPPFQLQGVIALTDTDTAMGGFHVCPGMHRYLQLWKQHRQPAYQQKLIAGFYSTAFPVKIPDPETTLAGLDHVVVPMSAGDLVIWRGDMAHGNGANVSQVPRLAQYVTMFPAQPTTSDGEAARTRVAQYTDRTKGCLTEYPQVIGANGLPSAAVQVGAGGGDKRAWEAKHRASPPLTPLGRKLLGLDAW